MYAFLETTCTLQQLRIWIVLVEIEKTWPNAAVENQQNITLTAKLIWQTRPTVTLGVLPVVSRTKSGWTVLLGGSQWQLETSIVRKLETFHGKISKVTSWLHGGLNSHCLDFCIPNRPRLEHWGFPEGWDPTSSIDKVGVWLLSEEGLTFLAMCWHGNGTVFYVLGSKVPSFPY